MNRREFIERLAASGALMAAMPVLAAAEQPARAVIGVDIAGGPDLCALSFVVREGTPEGFTWTYYSIEDGRLKSHPGDEPRAFVTLDL